MTVKELQLALLQGEKFISDSGHILYYDENELGGFRLRSRGERRSGGERKSYPIIDEVWDISYFNWKPFKDQPWEPKFLEPVLVRDYKETTWKYAEFTGKESDQFVVNGGSYWKYCIPYKGNENLLGKV